MGTATYINDVFLETGRYQVEREQSDEEVIFMLNIIGAVPEDAGEIGCQISEPGADKFYTKLDVTGEC